MHRGWLDASIPGGQAVYDFVRRTAPWEEVVPRDGELTFSVESRVWSCTDVTSTRLAATRAKDAICDALVVRRRGENGGTRYEEEQNGTMEKTSFGFFFKPNFCLLHTFFLGGAKAFASVCEFFSYSFGIRRRRPFVEDAQGWRPQPPAGGHSTADVPLFLSLYRDEAVMYRDMSGESLHRRGYRDAAIHRAALNESAAAGVLSIAGWAAACESARLSRSGAGGGGGAPYTLPVLVDPMCGSGTLLVEAALMAGCVAPGLLRVEAANNRADRAREGASVPSAFAFERRGG